MSIKLLSAWIAAPVVLAAALLITGSAPRAATQLTVIFNTDQNGYLTPCGCAKPVTGGMPRRATYLKGLDAAIATVLVDNGNLTKGAHTPDAWGRQDALKLDAFIDMYNALKYDAINLGPNEYKIGVPTLETLKARFKGKMLSANVRKADGSPLFEEMAIVEREVQGKKVRIGITGVISDKHGLMISSQNPGTKVDPASDTIQRVMSDLSRNSDLQILLFQGSQKEAEALGEGVIAAFTLVVFAEAGDYRPTEQKRVGNALLVTNGNDGKYVGRSDLTHESAWKAPKADYVKLTDGFADEPTIRQIKDSYDARVIAEDLLNQVPKSPTSDGSTYVGNTVCGSCHSEALVIWRNTKHAVAMKTLIDDKADKDPECVACHVVGMDKLSGFKNMQETKMLKDVGCEACHGPGSKHVDDPLKVKPLRGDENTCVLSCHVPEHSPNFNWPKYWEQIKH